MSTDRQRDKQTIRSQLIELPKYAASQGWKVVKSYEDDGKSGESIDGRPAFQALLEDAEKGLFDLLLVIDLDRITRSRRDQEGAFIYDLFRSHGIKIATPRNGIIDLENEDQDLQMGLLRVFAKYEKRKFLARTMRGKLQAARDGKRFGSGDPYGYRWVPDSKLKAGGGYQVREDEADVVRRIYDLAIEGQGVAMIAWMLESEGIQTRVRKRRGKNERSSGPWRRSSLLKILHSTTPAGQFRVFKRGGEPIAIQVPPIVSQDQWDAAQAALSRRKTSSGAPAKHEHLLRGHTSCGVCGYTMWIVLPRPGQARYAYYRCCTTNGWRGLGLLGPCGNKHHRVADVDAAVWDKLVQILRDPTLLGEACSLATKTQDEGVNWATQLHGLERKLATLNQASADVLRRQRQGVIPSQVADDELESIARERKLVDRNIKLARSRVAKASAESDLVQSVERQAKALSDGLGQADFETRRKLVALLLPRDHGCGVVLHRDGRIDVKGLLPLPADADGVELQATTRVKAAR